MISIPDVLVDRYELNDPETEDIVFGRELKNDSVVVTTNVSERTDISEKMDEFVTYRANIYNSWCRVTRLAKNEKGALIFIGVYADGTQVRRVSHPEDTWYVKADSITTPLDETWKKQIEQLVLSGESNDVVSTELIELYERVQFSKVNLIEELNEDELALVIEAKHEQIVQILSKIQYARDPDYAANEINKLFFGDFEKVSGE